MPASGNVLYYLTKKYDIKKLAAMVIMSLLARLETGSLKSYMHMLVMEKQVPNFFCETANFLILLTDPWKWVI